MINPASREEETVKIFIDGFESEKDYCRAELCVEACEGLSDEQVKEMRRWRDEFLLIFGSESIFVERKRLRDAVIEAAKNLRHANSSISNEGAARFALNRAVEELEAHESKVKP